MHLEFDHRLRQRHRNGLIFYWICRASVWLCLILMISLLLGIVVKAWPMLSWKFLTNFDSMVAPSRAGIKAGLWGSFWLIILTALFSVPAGVGAAVYLEEYAHPNRLTRLIQLNIANLAGVPSIVYGILGLTVFVRMFGLFGTYSDDRLLPFGGRLISGALTLSLLILPVIIIAAQEALRAVPASIRHGALALGATKWQTIRHQVLPAALPGILTGVILALSRAAGETAPLIMIGALSYIPKTPARIDSLGDIVSQPSKLAEVPFDSFSTMPLMIYNWASQAKMEHQQLAAAGIVVLLAVLLLMNTVAIILRQKFQKHIRW